MVREIRIKDIILGDGGDWGSGTTGLISAANSGLAIYSKNINGQILNVDLNFNQPAGSLALSISGTNLEFWRSNTSSGTSWLHFTPREFSQSTTGSIQNAFHQNFEVNGPICLTTGSLVSGTTPIKLIVRYR